MKYIFLVSFVVLSIAGIALTLTRSDVVGDKPIVYWQTQPSPEARNRAQLFRQWLAENGRPDIDLRIDPTSPNLSKTIIQGVSGVGGDLIQINIGADLTYLQEIGILEDLTDAALEHGFDTSTFASRAVSETTVNGRQYAYPFQLYVLLLYVNKTTFEELGLPLPPKQMNFETFERLGREFVERANPPGQPHRRFFAESVNYNTMRRSLGLDVFNETLTACVLDDARYERVLELIHRWTYDLRILPSAADISSFAATGGTPFGPRLYQFKEGNIGIIGGGNYLMGAMRQLGTIELAVIHQPAEEFPNALFGAGMLAMYRGSKNKAAAYEFLRFVASSTWNQSVAKVGDGIPANLQYAYDPDFLDPPNYPNEAGCNIVFVEAVELIGVPYSYSPFVPFSISNKIDNDAYQQFMAGRMSAKDAARRATELINREIERTLRDRPALREEYERRLERQKEIDRLRSEGKPVPLEWIDNPFHRHYYQFKGWVAP